MSKEEIIHGRHGDLFQRWYVQVFDHDIDLLQSKEGEALVVMMKDLTERLKSVGSCFVFVITPTKASVYPEDIPDRYLTNLNRGDRRQSNYDILVPFLKNYDIPYVDGRQITFEHKDSLPVRAFPTTGTHWSRAIAFFSAAALLETMAREAGREMPELSESAISIDGTPDLEDSDLFRLLNLTERQTNVIFTPFLRSGTTGPNEKEF